MTSGILERLLMAAGFVLVRGTLSGPGPDQTSHPLLYVAVPCVIIGSLQTEWDAAPQPIGKKRGPYEQD